MLLQIMLNITEKGDIVLDPFVGSGVTAIEALKRGRKALATDLGVRVLPWQAQECEPAKRRLTLLLHLHLNGTRTLILREEIQIYFLAPAQ